MNLLQSNKLRRDRCVRDGSGILLPLARDIADSPPPFAMALWEGRRGNALKKNDSIKDKLL